MHKTLLTISFTAVVCFQTLMAQTGEFGTWTSVGIERKWDKFDLGAETELRTIYGLQLIDRWSLGFDAGYKPLSFLKLSFGYNLMNVLDQKYSNYQFRNRFNLSATGKIKTGRLSFTLRERLQLTTKDESNRIKTDGTIDTYKINPALMWRNRLLAEYNIPNSKLTPSLSAESFYELNNPDGNSFTKMRYTLAMDYKLNKKNYLTIYGVYNNGLGTDDDDSGKYILGISYKFIIK